MALLQDRLASASPRPGTTVATTRQSIPAGSAPPHRPRLPRIQCGPGFRQHPRRRCASSDPDHRKRCGGVEGSTAIFPGGAECEQRSDGDRVVYNAERDGGRGLGHLPGRNTPPRTHGPLCRPAPACLRHRGTAPRGARRYTNQRLGYPRLPRPLVVEGAPQATM